MSLNFFDNECKERSRNNNILGLCDTQNGVKAYSDDSNPDDWIAIVKNDNSKDVVFTPIDNCLIIYKKDTKNKESTCDGMLTFSDSIFLVELKVKRTGGWLPEAIAQLKNTIKLIKENQNIGFKYKKAFACNRKHPSFTTIDNELSKRFFEETDGFRLDAQTEIIIK